MAGHVARKGNRWYAIVYEGTDPATGRERRRWHAAGPDRAGAEALADQLATAHARRRTTARGMTLQAFIHRYWLPGKQRQLRPTTLESYQRILRLHILPTLGHVALRGPASRPRRDPLHPPAVRRTARRHRWAVAQVRS